jgi:hypothetical protein
MQCHKFIAAAGIDRLFCLLTFRIARQNRGREMPQSSHRHWKPDNQGCAAHGGGRSWCRMSCRICVRAGRALVDKAFREVFTRVPGHDGLAQLRNGNAYLITLTNSLRRSNAQFIAMTNTRHRRTNARSKTNSMIKRIAEICAMHHERAAVIIDHDRMGLLQASTVSPGARSEHSSFPRKLGLRFVHHFPTVLTAPHIADSRNERKSFRSPPPPSRWR